MNVTPNLMEVLKNFSQIAGSIAIEPGNVVATVDDNKSLMGRAVVDVEFPTKIAIFDLPQFISVMSLFETPSIQFHDKYCVIGQGRESVRYFYSDPDLINKAPTGVKISEEEPNVTFTLTEYVIDKIIKSASILGVESASLVYEDDKMLVRVFDKSGASSNSYDTEVANFTGQLGTTALVFSIDSLKFVKGTYAARCWITQEESGIIEVSNDSTDLKYWLSMDVVQ